MGRSMSGPLACHLGLRSLVQTEDFLGLYVGGPPKNRENTPKWMVKIMENPIKMDDLGGKPLFLETPM